MPRERSAVSRRDDPTRPLTRRERVLVDVIAAAAQEGKELTRGEAGTAAGYGEGESARVQASRALARPRVKAALMDAVRDLAAADAPASYAVLRHVATKARSTRDRVTAAAKMLDIAGLSGGQPYSGQGIALQIVFRHVEPAALMQPATVIDADDAGEDGGG